MSETICLTERQLFGGVVAPLVLGYLLVTLRLWLEIRHWREAYLRASSTGRTDEG